MQPLLGCVCVCVHDCAPCMHTWGWAGEGLARNTLPANRGHWEGLGKGKDVGTAVPPGGTSSHTAQPSTWSPQVTLHTQPGPAWWEGSLRLPAVGFEGIGVGGVAWSMWKPASAWVMRPGTGLSIAFKYFSPIFKPD